MKATLAAILFPCLVLAAQGTLSVCEIANHSAMLDGKSVRVSGTMRKAFPDAEIFDELTDRSCPDVQIHIVFARQSLSHPPPPWYSLDESSARRAQAVAEKALTDGHDLQATIVGVLYKQERDRDSTPEQRTPSGVRVGPHHKWYPLVLLVQSIPLIKER